MSLSPVPDDASRARRAPPAWGGVGTVAVIALFALLMVAHALPYAASTVINDTSRDLYQALTWVEGEAWPLRGPRINGMASLGPAWFYVLALPLWLTRSVAASLCFLGLIAALKIPLAFAWGRRLAGPWLGLAFAVTVALPGWNVMNAIQVSHWTVIELGVIALGLILTCLWQNASRWWWAGFGLTLGLALHAHPTLIVFALPAAIVLWRRRARWREQTPPLAVGVALAIMPFAPMIYAEWRDGWPALTTLSNYASERATQSWLGGTLDLFVALARGGWRIAYGDLFEGAPRVAAIGLWLALLAALVVGLVPTVRQPHWRRAFAWASIALILIVVAVRVIRPLTPFYMAMPLYPALSLMLAVPLAALLSTSGPWRRVGWIGVIAAVTLQIAVSWRLIAAADEGRIVLPVMALGDIVRPYEPRPVALLPAWRLDHLGRIVCAERRPVVTHGELALLVDSALSMGSRLRCGPGHDVRIGGGADLPNARHLLGMVPASLRALGRNEADWRAVFALAPARVIEPAVAPRVADGASYPLRPRLGGPLVAREFTFEARCDQLAVIAHPFYAYDGARTLSVSIDEQAAVIRQRTDGVEVYGCATRAPTRATWRVRVENAVAPDGGVPEGTDVVLMDAPPTR